ncbi:MAG: ATP phosphoribosyltransferase regulatory subunit [Pyrinomonadaceae bacterium]
MGSRSMIVEAEMCSAISDVLVSLGFNDFTIRLNHRQLLDAMMSTAMIENEKRSSVLVIVDKLDKIGIDGVKRELSAISIPENSIDTIIYRMTNTNFLDPSGKAQYHQLPEDNFEANQDKLKGQLQSFRDFSSKKEGKLASDAIGNLQRVIDLTENTSASKHIKFDPSLARGLSYYTGAIMEINVPDLAGSLGGGGRYDNLVGMFSGRDVPACGFSLGLERIIVVMTEREMFPHALADGAAAADVLVTIWNEEMFAESLRLAGELRQSDARLRVDVYPEADKLGKQFKYAASRGIPFVVVAGDDERARGEVTLKNMVTGEQQSLAAGAISEIILKGEKS